MQTPLRMTALVAACLTAQGCILFTGSVNEPPHIDVLQPTMKVARGVPLPIVANASDPDGEPPLVEWSTSPGRCPTPLDASMRPQTIFISPRGTATFKLPVDPGAPATVCVWGMAVDAQGATAIDAENILPENRVPVATIKVLAPTAQTGGGRYPLYSYFRLSAVASDPDGDTIVDPEWTLAGMPGAATSRLAPCPGPTPSDFVRCLDVGGVAGDYRIELTVFDGLDRSVVATKTLVVDEDHPACVAGAAPGLATSPIVLDPSESKTFAVTKILDDGAPFPTPADGAHATPSFAWKVRRNGGAWQPIVGFEAIASLTLPGSSYTTGDKVGVSVTISDGVAMHLQPACDSQCPAGCPQSAEWEVEYR